MKSDLELERVFRSFDRDGDGKISGTELRHCVRTIGGELAAEEAEAVVRWLDSDGDGLLGLEDFMALMEAEGEEERVKGLREAFEMYDADGSGFITPKNLRRMLSRLGDSKYSVRECAAMIKKFDLNGDGVLSFDEFKLMMK